MRLTSRQQKLINEMLQEELQGALQRRRGAVNEAGPDVWRVNQAMATDGSVGMAVKDKLQPHVEKFVISVKQKIMQEVAREMAATGMVDRKFSEHDISDMLLDAGDDDQMLTTEFQNDLLGVCASFAEKLAQFVANFADDFNAATGVED